MVSIDEFIFRIYENPILRNVRKSDIVTHITSVLRLLSVPAILEDKRVVLNVQEYRTVIPRDVHRITSIMGMNVGGNTKRLISSQDDRITQQGKFRDAQMSAIQYKHVGQFIYTDFESGDIEVIYKGFSMDANGSPLIPDNESLLLAIENYIKVRHFTIGVETGTIPMNVLQMAEQQYAWYMGQASNSFTIPTPEETESLFNAIVTLLPKRDEHQLNYKYSGLPEVIRNH
jgi:hypothetical protein